MSCFKAKNQKTKNKKIKTKKNKNKVKKTLVRTKEESIFLFRMWKLSYNKMWFKSAWISEQIIFKTEIYFNI